MFVKEQSHFGLDPGRHVNTIGNMIDADLCPGGLWPECPPHLPGNFSMPLADGVSIVCDAQCKSRHVKNGGVRIDNYFFIQRIRENFKVWF